MKQTKLVITGLGAVTPIGIGVPTYWQNLIAGKQGIGPITLFDASGLPVQFAAEVRDFDPTAYMPKKLAGEMDRFMQFAYVSAQEALTDSGLTIEGDRTGIVMGTALDGLAEIARTQQALSEAGKKVGPRFLPKVLGNLAAGQIAIAHQIQGPCYTVNTACSSGADALSVAAMLLRAGEAYSMVVVGAESGICPLMIGTLSKAMALSRRNDAPEKACRPFDAGRDGFVMGEGSGALILETEAHARARGAKIYCELAGYANNTDAHHVTAPHPDGRGAAACMWRALQNAGMQPGEIGYINTHGTSTHAGDVAETRAIKQVFGDAVPPISSTKGATGHMMGAGGVTEVISCILALRDGVLPPTLNYETPDPDCDLDCVPNTARRAAISAAMSNALGFGGQNSSVIVRSYQT